MTFGEAIDAAKNGYRITRAGWNGKGMFVYYQEGSTIMEANCRNKVIRDIAAKNPSGRVNIRAHLDMFTAQGDVQIGWLASQSDILADDWDIVLNHVQIIDNCAIHCTCHHKFPTLYKEVKEHDNISSSSWYRLSDQAFAEYKEWCK